MVFTDLCPPALIYLLFSITQVVIDTVKGLYNTALIKIWVAVIFTILLNYLCQSGLGIISWLIVFVPFILMTLVVSILLIMFGLDPRTGKIKMGNNDNKQSITQTQKLKQQQEKNDVRKNQKFKKHKHRLPMHHQHGDNFPPHEHHVDENLNIKQDKLLDFYNKYLKNGQTTDNLDDNLDDNKTEKENKILQKSFLFYSTKEKDLSKQIQNGSKKSGNIDGNSANYIDENSINDVKYKLFIDDITNMLYGMGEQDIASWFKNKSADCLSNLNGLKKDYKKLKIEECFQDILNEILSKFNNNKKNLFKKNYKERVCQINETMDICKNRVLKGWW
jgi:hypothetical protein